MSRKNVVFIVILVLALTLSGCLSFLKPTLNKIVISADVETIEQGRSVNLEVKGFDKKNKEMEVPEPQWAADPEDLGELAADGASAVFTANEDAEGTVTITVTSGKLSDSIEITITKGETPVGPEIDFADLDQKIAQAESLLTDTEKGIYKGQAPVHAHHDLETAVDDAEAVKDDEDVTQENVNAAVTALQQAIEAFNAQIVTDEDPLKVYTFPIDSSDLQAFSAEKGEFAFNSDPKYIKTGTTSIKYTITGTPSDFRIRIDRKQGVWETDWTDYDYFAVWIYVEDVERLNKDVAVQWGYGHESGGVRITVPRSAFVNGWNELRFNLRDDLGFTDEDLANMTALFQLRLRNISGEDTLYIDEIRLLKLEEAEPVDKTYLEAAIQNAVELKGSILVGTEPGQAPQEAHDDLEAAINAAQTVYDDPDATQAEVDAEVDALEVAMVTFNEAIIKAALAFIETFDNVPDGTNIRHGDGKPPVQSLDNPDSFLRENISGTMTVTGGVLEVNDQRLAFIVPGLADAVRPVLIITLRSDNGSGGPVEGMKLYVGDQYSASGSVGVSGQRAHGEYDITNYEFAELSIELDTRYTGTGLIQLRPTVGGSKAPGLFIDKIEVVDEG